MDIQNDTVRSLLKEIQGKRTGRQMATILGYASGSSYAEIKNGTKPLTKNHIERLVAHDNLSRGMRLRLYAAAKIPIDDFPKSAAQINAFLFDESLTLDQQELVAKNSEVRSDRAVTANSADYVFITFILRELPHGAIGLLVAAFFAAALSSKAAELNALGTSTTIDFYRLLVKRDASDAECLSVTKWFTALWGVVAIAIALFAHLSENLIQAVNILGSIFYGVLLALFLVAFFIRRVGGTAIFWSAVVAQCLVVILYNSLTISYLWYPLIGCSMCVGLSLILQTVIGNSRKPIEV